MKVVVIPDASGPEFASIPHLTVEGALPKFSSLLGEGIEREDLLRLLQIATTDLVGKTVAVIPSKGKLSFYEGILTTKRTSLGTLLASVSRLLGLSLKEPESQDGVGEEIKASEAAFILKCTSLI